MVVNQQVLSLIDGLRKKGYKVGLLSNATGEVAARIKGLGVAAHFDVFLFSIEIGLQKPDLAAFKHLAKSLGAELSELVFVDDATVSLEIAEAGGFTPILFKSYDQLVTDLTALKVL
jgi:putative hydrolase of the HAD superfamily